MEPLRLAICDDLPEEREALLALLEQAPIATVCAQFASSEELLEAFRPGGFELLLMDIYMDGMTGVEAVYLYGRHDRRGGGTENKGDGRNNPHRLYHHQHRAYPGELPPFGAEIPGKACTAKRHQRPAASGEAAKGQRPPAGHPAKRRDAKNPPFRAFLSGAEGPSCVSVSQGRRQLEGQPFFCPHKSYCVNLAFVRGVNEEYQSYDMVDGKKVPISRSNRTKAKRAYEDFLFARTRGE